MHVCTHRRTHACTDSVVVVGRSVSDIPFITSYYFPLSQAAAAAAVNILFHCPVFLCFFSLSCIQLAFKQGRLWQGVNPAGGISPSPTKLLLLAIECQCAFLALPDELLDAHYSKMASYKSSFESLGECTHAHMQTYTLKKNYMPSQTYVCTQTHFFRHTMYLVHFHSHTFTHLLNPCQLFTTNLTFSSPPFIL